MILSLCSNLFGKKNQQTELESEIILHRQKKTSAQNYRNGE